MMPGIVLGVLSLIALRIALFARYTPNRLGGWRRTYVITAIIALYFNVFVFIAQLFMKVPALHDLAPTGKEPPFLIAQIATWFSSSCSASSPRADSGPAAWSAASAAAPRFVEAIEKPRRSVCRAVFR